ncbi:uncharacterized protein LOC108339867 isoform X1 [Vigna angularis]|uniref:uncharacterized protein LOC108339867 isoform X1 n=1 Tax=Phaseolus angularis TaxID=3914 RepID=UPI0022B5CE44|nr:uncharacterized protein LOC108339867 isoform X1 [Vigna angularis]
MRTLSTQFRSIKRPNPNPKLCKSSSPTKSELKFNAKPKSESESWCVYLILSTNHPIKTYVGITNNFPRRLKQHNGELNGGAKASRAGRPWICACIICGFADRSEVLISFREVCCLRPTLHSNCVSKEVRLDYSPIRVLLSFLCFHRTHSEDLIQSSGCSCCICGLSYTYWLQLPSF